MNKKLFLFDGNALAYRSYYAMGNLSNSSGQPTGAVLGFANYLVRIIKEHSPDYLAVAFDSGREGKRREIYPEYKANRAEMPEDLLSQLPLIYEFVDYMNISAFKKDGIEADDIISEIVSCDDIKGVDTYIVSGDKDLMQLVSDNVKLLAPSKQGGLSEMGPEEVKEKMGVPPERIIDLLSLMGDSSDNIPGVPGIGIKTAVKIVSEYGSIDNLLKDLDSIQKKSWKKKITENLKMLMMSRELVRLRHESNCSFKLDDMVYREPELNRAVEFLKEMEFNSLLREPVFDTRVASVFNHRRVGSIQELEEVVHKIREKGLVSVDTETTSLDTRGAELVGISFAVDKEEAFYIPVGHTDNDKNLDSES
ncbi:MAG: 5'-3' exonuclease H3TH domain-containing protein, partial [Chitinivibrionales bacterium]